MQFTVCHNLTKLFKVVQIPLHNIAPFNVQASGNKLICLTVDTVLMVSFCGTIF